MSLNALFLKDCQGCGGVEERTFADSWTGLELCLMCLAPIANNVTMSPASEGDNLVQLLRENGNDDFDDGSFNETWADQAARQGL